MATGRARGLVDASARVAQPDSGRAPEGLPPASRSAERCRIVVDAADGRVDRLVDHDLVPRGELGDGDAHVAIDGATRRPWPRLLGLSCVHVADLRREAEHRKESALGQALREVGVVVLQIGDLSDPLVDGGGVREEALGVVHALRAFQEHRAQPEQLGTCSLDPREHVDAVLSPARSRAEVPMHVHAPVEARPLLEALEASPHGLMEDDAINDVPLFGGQVRRGRRHRGHLTRVLEVVVVVRPLSCDGDRDRHGVPATPGSADPLLVVEPPRRHVRHHHGEQGADVDSRLHGRRNREQVDLAGERRLVLQEDPLETRLAGS